MMTLPKSTTDNLRFLCVEVDSQLANLQRYFAKPSGALARRILDRSGYAHNLKMRIHNSCFQQLTDGGDGRLEVLSIRSIQLVATDLDRLAELCRDSIKQMDDLADMSVLRPKAYGPVLERVRRGVGKVERAVLDNDTALALEIGRLDAKLERDYRSLLKAYTADLKEKKQAGDLPSALFVARNIQQMGEVLRNISESIISANLGQPVNLARYHSLQDSVEELDLDRDMAAVTIEPIAETRSGSAISGISASANSDAFLAIFKEGEKRKLKEERQGVNSWHEIYPGLAPRILSYKKRGQSAALLIEHLPGLTFEKILLHESPELLDETLGQLSRTLKAVWRETRTAEPVAAGFMQQLEKRLGDVYKIHPEFNQSASRIGGMAIPAFGSLVAQAGEYEKALAAPFSVYIHGDFNVDNILYDPLEKKINFIDLHRSRYMDYVQDVSVFMVSNYRLQILDAPLRRRILQTAQNFYYMAKGYAEENGDSTFELRLALGLARSFATSTRFILDKTLARRLFLRARYLIERVLATPPEQAANFKLPIEEIFVG